jgi:O-antigen ligase
MAARELTVFAGLVAMAAVVSGMREVVLAPSALSSIASAAYAMVILLLVAVTYLSGQPLNRAELFVGYDSYRFFNHVQSAALPLSVLAMTIAAPRGRLHAVACFASVVGFALLFAIMGRGTLVGIAAGAVGIGAMFGRAAWATLRSLGIAAVVGLLAYAGIFWLLPLVAGAPPGMTDGYYDARLGSVEMRFYLWRIALSYIQQAPWLGIGPMHYAHHPTGDAAHPHNIYLQVAAEWGVPMLVLLVAVYGLMVCKLAAAVRRCPDDRQRNCGVGLTLASIAIGVDGLFSGNFVMPVSQVWIAFAFGWALAWMRGQNPSAIPARSQHGLVLQLKRAGIAGLLLSQAWLSISIWPEVRNLDVVVKKAMEAVPSPTMNPRFWSHGWF